MDFHGLNGHPWNHMAAMGTYTITSAVQEQCGTIPLRRALHGTEHRAAAQSASEHRRFLVLGTGILFATKQLHIKQ